MGGKAKKAKASKVPPHPYAAIAAQTSFDLDALEVLAAHHHILSGFCGDPSSDDATRTAEDSEYYTSDERAQSTGLGLSLAQYCNSLSTLIFHGTAPQQFEYLFHAYAVESERGITRTELFQLLQDHYAKPLLSDATRSSSKSAASATNEQSDARAFERLYTWLKKHIVVFDRARCGCLPLEIALEMLHTHPTALQHVQLQLDPLVNKLRDNTARYIEKAAAAQIQ